MSPNSEKLQTSSLILFLQSATLLFFYPPARDAFNFPKLWILTPLVTLIFVHYFCTLRRAPGDHRSRFKLEDFLLLSILLGLMFSTFLTDSTIVRKIFGYPGRYNGIIYYLCIIIIIFVTSKTSLSGTFSKNFKRQLIVSSSLFGLYSVIQLVGRDPVDWAVSFNPIIGTLGNPNFSGSFMAIMCVAFCYLFLAQGTVGLRIFYSSIVTGLGVLSVLTGSLQAPILIAVGLLVIVLTHLYRKSNRKWFWVTALASAISGVVLFISLLGIGPFGSKLQQVTLTLRLNYWRVGLETARDNFFTGIGPDSYVEGFRLYRGSEFVKQFSDGVISDSAHNTFINIFANYGFLTFIGFLFLALIITKNALTLLFRNEKAESTQAIVAISWLLFLLQSMISIEQIGLSVYQWVIGGLLLNTRFLDSSQGYQNQAMKSKPRDENRFHNEFRSEIAVSTATLVLILTLPFMKEEISLNRFNSLDKSIPIDKAIELKLNEFSSYSRLEIRRSVHIVNFLLVNNRVNEAEELLENLISADPEASEAFEILARIAAYRGDLEREIVLRKKIEFLDPFNYRNFLSLAELQSKTGNVSEASKYAKKVITYSNDLTINESATSILEQVEN